jgi:Tfp pilus assembly protein PilO
VAALPRIVTQHDITIRPRPANKNEPKGSASASGELVLEAIAKTYRYLEEGATAPAPSAQKTASGQKAPAAGAKAGTKKTGS